jgi:hypothetical protein
MFSRYLFTSMLLAASLLPLGLLRGAEGRTQPQGGPQSQAGLLLLRNGYVLKGRISLLGQRYLVLTETGEIQVPVERAETFCLDMDEAYRFKRAAIDPRSAKDHRELAAWCLQHQLTRQAGSELFAADQIHPNHPTTRHLRQRLQLALRPPSQPAETPKPHSSRPSAAQLAVFIKNLPPGTLESFTHQIQPLLTNRCISCHSRPGAAAYELRRLARGRPADHRMTQANLYATLKFVDRKKPEASKLLVMALQPHGGSPKAALADRNQSQFRLLAGWAYGVARSSSSRTSVPKAVASQPKTVLQASGPLLQVMDPPDGLPAENAAVDKKAAIDKRAPVAKRTHPDTAGSPSDTAGSYVPRDPFDPEIFNRRYFSKPAKQPPSRAEPGTRGDRRIEFGVGRRPSSRPSRPPKPTGLQRPSRSR